MRTNAGRFPFRTGPVVTRWLAAATIGALLPLGLAAGAPAAAQSPVTTLGASPTTLNVGSPTTLTATITRNVLDISPDNVTFTVTAGPNAGLNLPSCTVPAFQTTCTTQYTSTLSGTDTIAAAVPGQSPGLTTSVTWLGVASVLAITPAASAGTTGQPVQLTATVLDQQNAPLVGAVVTFTVTGVGAATGQATTNASGNAGFSFTSPIVGRSTITASTPSPSGAVEGTATVDWGGPPASITITQGTTTGVLPLGASDAIVADVRDAGGLSVNDGTPVNFTVSGAGATTGAATTSGGMASFTFSSSVTGTSTITAGTGSLTSNALTVSWQTPTVSSLTLTPRLARATIGTQQLLVAEVDDQFGAGVPGVLVRFKVTGVNAQPTTSSTNTGGDGRAAFAYQGTNLGFDAITAFLDANANGVADPGELTAGSTILWGPKPGQGYWLVASDGGIFNYGPSAPLLGSAGSIHLNQPVVGIARTPTGGGYWLVASDGGIFNYGDAAMLGSLGSIHLNKPIVGIAPSPTGNGYWLVASDGGIFAFGDAHFKGSTGSIHLNQPIVGMAATPSGNGYWLVASDGGIFAFGDAQPLGSLGSIHLNQPIVGMAATSTGTGYWLAAADGGIFAFGNATPFGSLGSIHLNQPIVGIGAIPDDSGYYMVASDGGVFNFPANAHLFGSAGSLTLNKPMVGIAVAP